MASKKKDDLRYILEVKNFDFFYFSFQKQVLFDINLPIRKNRITAFIGPSGCGKTTLLTSFNRINELFNQEKTTFRGKIFFKGKNIFEFQDLNLLRKEIGIVFQKPNLYPMSIIDNITFILREAQGMSNELAKLKAVDALKQTGLWPEVESKLHEPAFNLSGGQQQRLCIARVIALKPKVILFDEPTASLDHNATAIIEELIVRLKKEYTVIIVTHSLQQTSKIADYTAFLFGGRVIEFAKTKQLFYNPRRKLTQLYITGRWYQGMEV
jgi:phosphate transport system ATP-binding protein